jgi:hypothetical protein
MLKDGGGSLLFTGATMSLRKCNGSPDLHVASPMGARLPHIPLAGMLQFTSTGRNSRILADGVCSYVGGGANFSISAPTAFARRGLSQSLAREFGPKGIRVAHVIVDGIIETERIKGMMGEAKGEATVSYDIFRGQVLRC